MPRKIRRSPCISDTFYQISKYHVDFSQTSTLADNEIPTKMFTMLLVYQVFCFLEFQRVVADNVSFPGMPAILQSNPRPVDRNLLEYSFYSYECLWLRNYVVNSYFKTSRMLCLHSSDQTQQYCKPLLLFRSVSHLFHYFLHTMIYFRAVKKFFSLEKIKIFVIRPIRISWNEN